MPCEQLKTGISHVIAGGRVQLFFTKDGGYSVIAGTNDNKSMVHGLLSDLSGIQRVTRKVQVEKDGVSVSKTIGTGLVNFYNKHGLFGSVDCNSSPNATQLVKIFYMATGVGHVKGIENACDPDPSKKKKSTKPRTPKKAPTTSSSSSKKSEGKKKKQAPPPIDESSDDDDAGLAEDSDDE